MSIVLPVSSYALWTACRLRRGGWRVAGLTAWLAVHGLAPWAPGAQIILPACYGENMVLQSTNETLIWGWSDLRDGEVEFRGKKAAWKNVKESPDANKNWVRWEASIHNATNPGPATLLVRAGTKHFLGAFKEKTVLTFTNLYVGEVWIWFAKNHPRAPQAEIPEADRVRLASSVHVLKTRLQDVIGRGTPAQPAWTPCNADTVAAEACYFLTNRTSSLPGVPIGLIEVPWTDLRTNGMPAGPPAEDTWRTLDDDRLRKAFHEANRSASALFSLVTQRHARDVNQLKMLGIVTNALLLNWSDMDDFKKVRLVTMTNLQPLSVSGTIW